MDETKNEEAEKELTLEEITERECGKRLCKCGDKDCEFAADFFNEDGTPTAEFGNDDDLIAARNLEAAEDFSDYARRVGMLEAYTYDGVVENGEALYHNTATYRMIDTDDDSADTSKS